jgi:hypothetical protein
MDLLGRCADVPVRFFIDMRNEKPGGIELTMPRNNSGPALISKWIT